MQRPLSCSLQHLTFNNLKRAPFALQNESFFLAHPKQAHPERIPNASRTHPEGKQFPPEKTKIPFPVLYLIIYEKVKNVAHLKKDA